MKNPRVLITADAAGGVWTFVLDLVSGLEKAGCEVLLVLQGGEATEEVRARISGLRNTRLAVDESPLEWMDDPWDAIDRSESALLALEREFRPDVIHLNSYAHAAFDWSAPVMVTAHSCVFSWWEAVEGCRPPLGWCEYHARVTDGLASAHLVATPTQAMLDGLERNYEFDTPRIVLPNGRPLGAFRSSIVRGPLILSAGRVWDRAKNAELLARIAPALKYPVRLAGDTVHPITREPASWGGVDLPGRLNPAEMRLEMASAAIYAAPALYEPFGLAVLEAAASGCALVLADIPSFRELWQDCAVFCDPGNDAQWTTVLNRLAEDDRWRSGLARAAIARARHFTAERMTAGYLHCYRGLAALGREGGRLAA